MAVSDKVDDVAQDTREQLHSLRLLVEQLLNKRVTPVLADAADRAEVAVTNARDLTNTQVANVSEKVRGQPIIAIGISAVVGYLVGRLSR